MKMKTMKKKILIIYQYENNENDNKIMKKERK